MRAVVDHVQPLGRETTDQNVVTVSANISREETMSRLIAGALLALSTNVALAGSTFATIDHMLIYEAGGTGLVYVYPTDGVDNPPPCHGANGDYYSFSMSRPFAREYYSILMAAMMAKSSVRFWGTGDCTDQSVSETLNYIMVSAP